MHAQVPPASGASNDEAVLLEGRIEKLWDGLSFQKRNPETEIFRKQKFPSAHSIGLPGFERLLHPAERAFVREAAPSLPNSLDLKRFLDSAALRSE